ncbi:hypothetical protein CK203_031105 [Vitis vinifera]|uniref:Uncharacterized protein n=1 Tax=Vitis vinifera TaxID=29760 RepID=A0A438J0N8_VITVI|nr:hypothetical protein CK203_031105 [Vitis vinifera]
MPSTENQGSASPFVSFGRSILSIRREQIHSMEANHDPNTQESEIELFLQLISKRFHDLSVVSADELLSLAWMWKLLDAFICCHEEFRVILLNNKVQVCKPPLDRLVAEFFDRCLKALDIFPSSKKALMDLAIAMLDEKETGSIFSHRNRSFGRHQSSKDQRHHLPGHSRSLSWSVSRSWSAAKQLQSIANNLVPPRGNDISATNGLAVPVFAMSYVLMFVLWALVAAIPCQDRGLQIHCSVPRHFSWGAPFILLQERITEESKKRERRNSSGLLKEINQMERCASHMTDLVDSVHFPLTDELKTEAGQQVQEVTLVCEALKNGLDPLERQVREVFRKIMNGRTEGLEFLGSVNKPE